MKMTTVFRGALLAWLALMGLLVAGCSNPRFPNHPLVDRSLITGDPCEAPCWYGLELNRSTTEDIRKTLNELPFVDQSSIFEQLSRMYGQSHPNKLIISFNCVYTVQGDCGFAITSEEGLLIRLHVIIAYPLNLKSLIDKLGEPQFYVYIGPLPQVGDCLLTVDWTYQNIHAEIIESPGDKLCSQLEEGRIDPDLQINSVFFTHLKQPIEDVDIPWPGLDE